MSTPDPAANPASAPQTPIVTIATYWLGVFLSWSLYGAIVVLASRYFNRSRSDPLYVRIFVGYMLLHNSVESGLLISGVIKKFGIHYGDYVYLFQFHREELVLFYFQFFNALLVQFFLVLRAFLFSRAILRDGLSPWRKALFAAMLLSVVATGGFGVVRLVLFDRLPNRVVVNFKFSDKLIAAHGYTIFTVLALSASSMTDIIITFVLSASYADARKSNKNSINTIQRLNSVLRHLVFITIRNGSLMATLQFVGLLLFILSSSSWQSFMSYVLSRVYTLTLLVYISSPRQLSRDLAKQEGLPVFSLTPNTCTCSTSSAEKTLTSNPGKRLKAKIGRLARPASLPRFKHDSQTTISSTSRRSRKRTRTPTHSSLATPRIIVLEEDGDEEREWLHHRKILVDMSSSISVSVEDLRAGDAGSDGGIEEDWQTRRDRLALGNCVVVETRSPSSPSAFPVIRDLTHGTSSRSIPSLPSTSTSAIRSIPSSPPSRRILPHRDPPTITSSSSYPYSTVPSSPLARTSFTSPSISAVQRDTIDFINSFPNSPVVSMSSGVYDPDAEGEYELGKIM